MATTSLTNSFKRDILNGVIDLSSDTIKAALYSASSHGVNTTAYTATNEASGTGYTATGQNLAGATQATDTSNNVSYYDWNDVVWTSSTITATDVMFYDDTVTSPTANVAIYIGDFGGSRSSSSGAFTLTLPTPAHNTAVVRIA